MRPDQAQSRWHSHLIASIRSEALQFQCVAAVPIFVHCDDSSCAVSIAERGVRGSEEAVDAAAWGREGSA